MTFKMSHENSWCGPNGIKSLDERSLGNRRHKML